MNMDDITDQEVVEFFSYGIREQWVFQKFVEQKPRIAAQFHTAIETLIEIEERTRERFPSH